MQENVGEFWELHPAGSPAYAYVNAPVPPFAVTVKVIDLPITTLAGLTTNDEIVMDSAAGSTWKGSEVADPVPPFESVAVTLTTNAPATVGVQLMVSLMEVLHPRCELEKVHLYVNPPEPPEPMVEKMTDWPTIPEGKEGTGTETDGFP
jgi:hypothetical protein